MSHRRQRQWKSLVQQRALLDYGLVKRACPEGVYVSLTPGNFALWGAVLFVRKGPYAPAILRFQIAFPQDYPDVPPLVLFTSDIFHPLVTPLTTYTYTTGSDASETVSATDDERLLPGGFSLRHGFPYWFEKIRKVSPEPSVFRDVKEMAEHGDHDGTESDAHSTRPGSSLSKLRTVHMPPPKDEGGSSKDTFPSIVEVLRYVKQVFEEETLLDDLPVEAAGNPGAWHAWRAYRRKSKPARGATEKMNAQLNTPQKGNSTTAKLKAGTNWNWDGVWVERAKRGINTSLSEAVLFGSVEADDLIHFLDLEEEETDTLRKKFFSAANGDDREELVAINEIATGT